MGILYEEELAELTALFDNLPQNIPQYPSNSTLPPEIDQDFLQDEGAWVTFNNTMDSAFGDKTNDLKIAERGSGLNETISLIFLEKGSSQARNHLYPYGS
ncbi:hypothetical protein M422DRAFT_250418 [Sphaerobolus stellatus SS14]|uniref:Uncharacterized protein n=1 Tax=Sphaerobolus stellatus (strain SS14) TaxID=990650 RepID=A0A0C9W2W2_SPHS4|nr:hypothetical protein M422DRAFT_250418 [Sphaerobolus stellatus SS14]